VTIVLMGVSGSGKTAVGTALAGQLGCRFVDGDDLHPAANVEKMAHGIPLNDTDRRPWLLAIRTVIQESEGKGQDLIVACSALKQEYRNYLNSRTHIRWVFLNGAPELIRNRLRQRAHHFMTSALLDSQLDTLQPPNDALVVHIAPPVDAVIRSIREGLGI
jgi:gluconokinase